MTTFRRIAAASLLLLLAGVVGLAQGFTPEYIASLFDGRQLAPVEGVWRFPGDGATIAVVRDSAQPAASGRFTILLLDSPRLDIKPGTCIGSALLTPRDNVYDARLDSGKLGRKLKLKSERAVLTVHDNGALGIEPYKSGYSVSFRRWFYRLLGVSLLENKRPKGLDGARRVYPYITSDHLPVCL